MTRRWMRTNAARAPAPLPSTTQTLERPRHLAQYARRRQPRQSPTQLRITSAPAVTMASPGNSLVTIELRLKTDRSTGAWL